MLEFALVLPLLGLLILGMVEYTKLFKIKEFQALVTREAGTAAFRYCFEREERSCVTEDLLDNLGLETRNNFQACLTRWRDEIRNNRDQFSFLEGVDLSISFWEYVDPDSARYIAGTTKTSQGIDPTDSHYYPSSTELSKFLNDFLPMIKENEIIVISESYVTFPFFLINIFTPGNDRLRDSMELYHVSAY